MSENEEEQGPRLAKWTDSVEPATLSTRTGKERFVITIKLPERSLKLASSLVRDVNSALAAGLPLDMRLKLSAPFTLVDSERARLQRATALFSSFKEARACLACLADAGLRVGQVSAELEDYGAKQYDPWRERMARSWWPWLAALFDPAPEMPMMKVTNRLNLTEGTKYKESASGRLGKGEEIDRAEAEAPEAPPEEVEREAPPKEEGRKKGKAKRKRE